jgi:glutamyl-tRNA synthetase
METIKTRFAPSPTGSLHVGGARTALFSYALARKTGGQFLVRIEDTDRARHQEDAVENIVRDLTWLGLAWDEGIAVGGGHGPYRQSERLEIYKEHIQKLLDTGRAYYAFETAEELDTLRQAAESAGRGFKYPRPETLPTAGQADDARAEGRPVVVRLLCPGCDVTFRDEVFGEVTTPAGEQDDFIIAKADGWPTYHLANVVDDALMGVNFVCRGQEFLGQTWRHVLLREALEYPEPQYAHLPLIMDMQGRKLSKRDGDVEVDSFRRAGLLPDALVNFLMLLGWNPGTDQESFTLEQFVAAFDISRVNKANAKFDRDKLLAFNTDAMASAEPARLAACFDAFLADCDSPVADADAETRATLLAITRGARSFQDVIAKCEPLFCDDGQIEYDPKAVKKVLAKNDGQGLAILGETLDPLADLEPFTAETIEAWLGEFCTARELGMGKVAQPIRVAVTGTMVSPGIGDTLELLGRDKTLTRIRRCQEICGDQVG